MEVAKKELGFAEMILRKGRPKKKKVPVIKKSEVEQKLLFEMEMRSAAQRLLTACSNPQQRLDAAKTILTSNSRTLALMTALQKEHVKEVEDAHGLTEIKDKEELLKDEMLDTVSLADVTISNVVIPLKWCRIDPNKYKSDCWKYQVFCLIRSGIQVIDSKKFCKVDLLVENISFEDKFVLKGLSPDFTIDFEFYYAQSEESTKNKKNKKGDQYDVNAPVYAIGATASLTLAHCNIWQQKQSLRPGNIGAPAHIAAPSFLPDLPPLPVLNFYRSEIDVVPNFTLKPSKEGFLDVQHMAGGMPHWVRCWCVLQGMYLKVWKQPEDQFVSLPTVTIEINEHVVLDHTSRASLQRPHTIHVSYSKSPYTDHFLSTDTKEDRILWEIALHKAMINASTWHPNKLSSSQNIGTSPSPLKSPPPKPPRPITTPQFSYTPSAPCLPSYKAQYDARTHSEANNRLSRFDKLLDYKTPKKRSKSVDKKRTPFSAIDKRSRANTCSKPNRRRSRSVDLSPRPALSRDFMATDTPSRSGSRDAPSRDNLGPPKRDRVSDATYVSMHKFSRIPETKSSQKPTRPAPQPPSLSKIPNREKATHRPLSGINESYRAAVSHEPTIRTKRQPGAPSPAQPSSSDRRRSPRLQALQVDMATRDEGRRKKGRAPVPQNNDRTPRSKKSPAPSPHKKTAPPRPIATPSPRQTGTSPSLRKAPRQSKGGTNNLNSPNRSGKKKQAFLNVINESCGELSPSIEKISNSTSSIPSESFDFEGLIDDAFGSLYKEGTLLSVDTATTDTTPSFHPANLPSSSIISGTPKRGQKVARNTPLTSTMRENAVPFTPPNVTNVFGKGSAPSSGSGFKITPICEEGEEDRGESLLAGYFDSSSSTINSDKENTAENNTPTSFSDLSPIKSSPFKRRSTSPAKYESPPKRASPRRSRESSRTNISKEAADLDSVKECTDSKPVTRPKPKFQVVNGKLVPL